MFRRMHRKILVVDGKRAFVGGINYSADHLADFGPQAKQDYAVEIEGPIVDTIRRFARAAPRDRAARGAAGSGAGTRRPQESGAARGRHGAGACS